MTARVSATPHIQLVDIAVEHQYADDGAFERIADKPVEELGDDAHYHWTLPLHRDAQVRPDDPTFGFTVARVTFTKEGFYVDIPQAPHKDWMWTAHGNILAELAEQEGIQPDGDGARAHYNHGIPHPLLDARMIDGLLQPASTTVTDHEADWYEPSHTVVRYDLDDGPVYLDFHTDNVFFGEEELAQEFSYHVANALEARVDSSFIDVQNPHGDIFDAAVLHPAFAQEESLITLWNTLAPEVLDTDLGVTPNASLRNELRDIGMEPLPSLLGWILLGCCLEYEMPAVGDTAAALQTLLEHQPVINWNNTTNALDGLAGSIEAAISEEYYDYGPDALPKHDGLFRLHAGNEHMQLAVEPVGYRPVFFMGSADDWDESMAIDDFFWAHGGWYFEMKAARPCDAEDGDFDPTEVYEYMDSRDGDRTIVALASNLQDVEPITQEEVDKTMISVVGAPTPKDSDSI